MHESVLAALRRGAPDEALAAARAAVEESPEDPQAQRLLAAALRLSGDADGALDAIDRALERAPEDPFLHLERAALVSGASGPAEAMQPGSTDPGARAFPAHIAAAQLELAHRDLDEAERRIGQAAELAPGHPHVAALGGVLELSRGRVDEAFERLSAVDPSAGTDPMLGLARAFADATRGRFDLAEQAFRDVLAVSDYAPLHALLADVVRKQGRPGDAADQLAPLLQDPAAGPAMHRLAGELALQAGRPDDAIVHLKHALARMPGDRRTLSALLDAWQRRGDRDDARSTLDAALATHPHIADLWFARLGVEAFAGADAIAVIDRWLVAMPDHVPALTARSTALDASGDAAAAEAVAQRIVDLEPGHVRAEMRLLNGLMARDPAEAAARIDTLLSRAQDPGVMRALQQLRGFALDRADRPAEAVSTWLALHAAVEADRIAPPAPTMYRGPFPSAAARPADAAAVALLWGPPGSLVERVAATLAIANGPLLQDRFGPRPPDDAFQDLRSAHALVGGERDGGEAVAQWRHALPARGARDDAVIDWLPYWDNAFALALRPHLPEAGLLVILRDPRDMLVDWLAFGSPAPFRFGSVPEAAHWLATQLEQIVDIEHGEVMSFRSIRMDRIAHDPRAISRALADALDSDVPVAPAEALQPPRLPAGHWRRFAEPLAEAFEILRPVAARLGYTA